MILLICGRIIFRNPLHPDIELQRLASYLVASAVSIDFCSAVIWFLEFLKNSVGKNDGQLSEAELLHTALRLLAQLLWKRTKGPPWKCIYIKKVPHQKTICIQTPQLMADNHFKPSKGASTNKKFGWKEENSSFSLKCLRQECTDWDYFNQTPQSPINS